MTVRLTTAQGRKLLGGRSYGVDRSAAGRVERTYDGIVYDSKAEMRYAQELDLRVKAREIDAWERQWPIPLIVNGVRVTTVRVDFLVHHNDGSEEFVEVKGFEKEIYKLRAKLLRALFPNLKYTVVKV
jgi:DNA-binding sugar fermentation-stimulating protein